MEKDIDNANKICKIISTMNEDELRLMQGVNEQLRKLKIEREVKEAYEAHKKLLAKTKS